MRALLLLTLFCFQFLLNSLLNSTAHAIPVLPYSVRLQDYSGWNGGVRGDANTVGMAGATVAVPSSIASAESNPAGFAMETGSVSAQINRNTIHDRSIQKSGDSYDTFQGGLAVTPNPWGFGVTTYQPTIENGQYISPGTNRVIDTEISVRQIRLNIARAFFDARLAIGVSADLFTATRTLNDFSYNSSSLGFQIGALYRMADHMVAGLSLMPQSTMLPSGDVSNQTDITGFNRAVISPTIVAAGFGWIPNRFFKAAIDFHFIAPTDNTALLADQTKAEGQYLTVEPRLGMSYVVAEYQNFKIEYAMGTYYEPARVEGDVGRLHATTGLDINPYFINTSLGFDLAHQYRNIMISVGFDIVRTLRTFDIIPKDPVPPYRGFFPRADHVSAEGMPEGMTKGETQTSAPPSLGDVEQIIKDIPQKIMDKVSPEATPVKVPEKKKPVKKKRKKKPHPATQPSPSPVEI